MSATEQQVQSHYQATADTPADRLEEKTGDDLLQFVICLIGSEEFAVDVLSASWKRGGRTRSGSIWNP